MLLKDKVVIVSGIGPGLGIELALLAAQEGAKLAICARTASKLDAAERDVAALGLGTEVLKVPTDIADREQCRKLVERTVERFGRVDALINSAYVGGGFGPIETADLDDWRATMDINFFGTMKLTQEVIPHMKRQGGGAEIHGEGVGHHGRGRAQADRRQHSAGRHPGRRRLRQGRDLPGLGLQPRDERRLRRCERG